MKDFIVRFCLTIVLFTPPCFSRGASCPAPSYDCALRQVQHGDLPNAISGLRGLLTADPQNLKVLNLLGIALTQSGQLLEANEAFEKALAIDGAFYPAAKNLAFNELKLQHTDRARKLLLQVLQHAPEDPASNLYLAELERAAHDCTDASEHYSKAHSLVFRDPVALMHNAQCDLQSGRLPDALRLLDALPADSGEAQFEAGLLLSQSKNYREAAEHFRQARETYPDRYAVAYNQLLTEMQAGLYEDAIRDGKSILSLQEFRRSELYNLLSTAYAKAGDLKSAYDQLREAARIDPYDESNYLDLAALMIEHSNYDLAREILSAGLHSLPSSERLYLELGVVNALSSHDTDARSEFETAIKIAPEAPLPRFALGLQYLEAGETDRAVAFLKESASRIQESALIYYLYAVALTRTQQLPDAESEALRALQKSVQLDPQFSPSRMELGKLLAHQGQLQAAKQQLTKALELDQNNSGALSQLMLVCRRTGELAEAEKIAARLRRVKTEESNAELHRSLIRIVRETAMTAASMPALHTREVSHQQQP